MTTQTNRIIAAPDKFKGTATSTDVALAIGRACARLGLEVDLAPMADGGDGTLEVLGFETRTSLVKNALGEDVPARWGFTGTTAAIEMAEASGLALITPDRLDPMNSDTFGTGQLIAEAIDAGATDILVGVGGSASTDGGSGALRALESRLPLSGVSITVLTDVRTTFLDTARVFGPQKGASAEHIEALESRLRELARQYKQRFGVDVTNIDGSGAAGGLAGGLFAIGAHIEPGFDYLARRTNLETRIAESDAVVTGEGEFDEQSLNGKVVGGVIEIARRLSKPVIVIAGRIEHTSEDDAVRLFSLVGTFGLERSLNDTLDSIEELAVRALSSWILCHP